MTALLNLEQLPDIITPALVAVQAAAPTILFDLSQSYPQLDGCYLSLNNGSIVRVLENIDSDRDSLIFPANGQQDMIATLGFDGRAELYTVAPPLPDFGSTDIGSGINALTALIDSQTQPDPLIVTTGKVVQRDGQPLPGEVSNAVVVQKMFEQLGATMLPPQNGPASGLLGMFSSSTSSSAPAIDALFTNTQQTQTNPLPANAPPLDLTILNTQIPAQQPTITAPQNATPAQPVDPAAASFLSQFPKPSSIAPNTPSTIDLDALDALVTGIKLA